MACVVENGSASHCDVMRAVYVHCVRYEIDCTGYRTERDGPIEHMFCRNYLDCCLLWKPDHGSQIGDTTSFMRPLPPLSTAGAEACRYLMQFGLVPTLTREQMELRTGSDQLTPIEAAETKLRRAIYDEAWSAAGQRFALIVNCLSSPSASVVSVYVSASASASAVLLSPLARIVAEYESYSVRGAIESSYECGRAFAARYDSKHEMRAYESNDNASLLATLRAEMKWLGPPTPDAAAASAAAASAADCNSSESGPRANTDAAALN